MARKTREQRPKVRRQWSRSPVTQIQSNRRESNRQRDKLDGYGSSYEVESAVPAETCGRILGIDFGERRLGVAVSDSNGWIAQGLKTLEASEPERMLDAVGELILEHEVRTVVIGHPMNMDGTESAMAKTVQTFAEKIEDRTGCNVIKWDERLTSAAAERAMAEMGRSPKGHKTEIDRIAATIILQGYLDYLRHAENSKIDGRDA